MLFRFAFSVVLLVTLIGGWPIAAHGESASSTAIDPLFAPEQNHVTYGPDGGYTIDGQANQVETTPISIEGGKRYELAMHARVDGRFVVEHNARAHKLALDSFRHRLASAYLLIFVDDNNEEISRFGYESRGFFITEQWHRYVMAFHTPAEATAVKVRFTPSGHTTHLRDASLADITDQQTINLNPDFRYGELNYSGWNPRRDGRLYQRPDDVVVLRPGYGGTSPIFPLNDSVAYEIRARGEGGRINMTYFDEEGNRLHSRFLIRPGDGEEPVEFTPPQGVRFGRLIMYGVAWVEACPIRPVTATSD